MKQQTLFDQNDAAAPLAERLRPQTLDEIVGQEHLLGKGKILRRLIENDQHFLHDFLGAARRRQNHAGPYHRQPDQGVSSSIFPPLPAASRKSAPLCSRRRKTGVSASSTIVFVDEIHRFNKAQQDAFLPFVEKGSIILIGATTENPSFEVNGALLSRCKVFVLQALKTEDIGRTACSAR